MNIKLYNMYLQLPRSTTHVIHCTLLWNFLGYKLFCGTYIGSIFLNDLRLVSQGLKVRWTKYWKNKSLQEPAKEPLSTNSYCTICKQLFHPMFIALNRAICLLYFVSFWQIAWGRSEEQPRPQPVLERK